MPDIDGVTILLVDDNAGHTRLIQKNLRRATLENPVIVFADGLDAIDYIFNPDGTVTEAARKPLLIVLDLNMPGLDGHQILARIKQHRDTRHIPVIVLTTSDNPHEMEKSYQLGCSVFITKPVEHEEFANAIQQLGRFLAVITLPEGGG